jgi:serine/threonine protein kinase
MSFVCSSGCNQRILAVALPNARVPPTPNRLLRQAGAEPIPGYRLVEPLGSGGFGDVWKCVAPGGLMKAVKLVGGEANAGGSLAAQEFEAIERIKSIRHPFLLSLERVEVVDGVLVLIMELADRNLQNVLLDYQQQGLPGIPRKQLLGFLEEAAEALDVINFQHGLQHLDVKPHNLFVVSNHVKVADFGLVHRLPGLDADPSAIRRGGATPLYASPETLQGSLSRHSDQYSLAIVYQQLLTGTVPYWSANPYQLLLQHIAGIPDLSALPLADQPLMARALAKSPDQRFASCIDFVRALVEASDSASGVRPNLRSIQGEITLPAFREENRPAISLGAQSDQRTVAGLGAAELAHLTLVSPVVPTATTSAADPVHLPQPSGLVLPGYRFVTCVGRTPLGCLWTVEDSDGQERLAHCFLNVSGFTTETLTRLQTLRHPALPAREVFWVPPGSIVLISDSGRQSLRDRFDQCRVDGLPGVPREVLLNCLTAAAHALDELNSVEKLSHLGLTPAHLLLEGDQVLIEDFGLAPLLWLAQGKPAALMNPRYAAPELAEPISSPSADQFSLALIYTEMFTGISPKTKAKPGKSGVHRRPKSSEAGSGPYRRPPASAFRQAGAAVSGKVDLDFLPPDDRPVIARALNDDPACRYSTCTAFVEALRAATPSPVVTEEMLASLPLVTPFACLMGKAPPSETVVPTTHQVAVELIATVVGLVNVCQADDTRYIVHSDGAWEYRLPIRMVAGLMRLKLEGFRHHWNAELASRAADAFVFKIPTNNGKARFWSAPKPAGVELEVRLHPSDAPDLHQREAVVRVGLFGDHGTLTDTILPSTAPRLFQSLRAYLQGGADQRGRERWTFSQRVGVYPIQAHLEIGHVLDGRCQNVSLNGVCVQVPQQPPSEYAYLHFHETPATAPLAVLSRIVRAQAMGEGVYELGVTFAPEALPGNAAP